MSRKCELTGVAVQYGNKVSHSQRKTRRCFRPNLRNVVYKSDVTGLKYSLRVAAKTMRTVDHNGGFDSFMMSANADHMSVEAQKIKRSIVKKATEAQQQ